MKSIFKNFIVFLLVFIILAGIFSTYNAAVEPVEEVGIQNIVQEIERGNVKSIAVKGSILEVSLNDGTMLESKKESTESFSELMNNFGVDPTKTKNIDITIRENEGFQFWLTTLLPFLLPFIFIIGFKLFGSL